MNYNAYPSQKKHLVILAISLKSSKRHQKMFEDEKRKQWQYRANVTGETCRISNETNNWYKMRMRVEDGKYLLLANYWEGLVGVHLISNLISTVTWGMLSSTNQWRANSHADWGYRWKPKGKHNRLVGYLNKNIRMLLGRTKSLLSQHTANTFGYYARIGSSTGHPGHTRVKTSGFGKKNGHDRTCPGHIQRVQVLPVGLYQKNWYIEWESIVTGVSAYVLFLKNLNTTNHFLSHYYYYCQQWLPLRLCLFH